MGLRSSLAIALAAAACGRPDALPPAPASPAPPPAPSAALPLPMPETTPTRYEALGATLEVHLELDKPRIVLGEPMHFSFVVDNRSRVALTVKQGGDYRNRLGRPESFRCHAERDGARVAVPDAGMGFGGAMGFSPLPARGSHRRRLFLPHWAPFEEPGRYRIHCAITLALRRGGEDDRAFEPHAELEVEASAELEVSPRDDVSLGLTIDELGRRMMLTDAAAADEAREALGAIHDRRTITHWRQAIASDDYTLKFAGTVALGRYDDDEALAGLKDAMRSAPAAFGNATDTVKPQLAENIRVAAAQALAESPHAGALPALWTMEQDAAQGVRLTVVHALAKQGTGEARRRLEAIARRGDGIVSQEAARYLRGE